MTIATQRKTSRIINKINSTYEKMEGLYATARILRSELDLANGRYSVHTSVNSLIHELEN